MRTISEETDKNVLVLALPRVSLRGHLGSGNDLFVLIPPYSGLLLSFLSDMTAIADPFLGPGTPLLGPGTPHFARARGALGAAARDAMHVWISRAKRVFQV